MKPSFSTGLALACLSCLLSHGAPAHACGGCFHPELVTTPSVVTGHRMAFAVSPGRTVLWDQIEYSGSPEDFSWVLPVRPGAYIEASTDAWFEALETMTQVRVSPPPVSCAQSSAPSGCGCGAMAESADSAPSSSRGDPSGGGGVQVLHRGTVGQWGETVTLRSTNGDELTTWLRDNGYFVPTDIEPIIAAYVLESADFIAVRMRPSVGVQAMTPVRVITPGGDAILPLRMVAAGTGERVGIVLYVIGEELFGMPDLHPESVAVSNVAWDFNLGTSNYAELRKQALARNLGFSYLTTFADRGFFSKTSARLGASVGTRFLTNFADLYFAQAQSNDGLLNSTPCPSIAPELASDLVVRDDAGAAGIPASSFACGAYTDIAAAVTGMRPSSMWTGRLELDLPREALSMDCVVTRAESQEPVSQLIQAPRHANLPPGCTEPVFTNRLAPAPPTREGAWLTALVIAALLRLRRQSARTRA